MLFLSDKDWISGFLVYHRLVLFSLKGFVCLLEFYKFDTKCKLHALWVTLSLACIWISNYSTRSHRDQFVRSLESSEHFVESLVQGGYDYVGA